MPENPLNPKSGKDLDTTTKWAYERTILANERTYIAWLRTGLAITGGSAIFLRLLGDIEPVWLVNFLTIVVMPIAMLLPFSGPQNQRPQRVAQRID